MIVSIFYVLLAFCLYSLDQCLLKFLPHFKNGLFVFLWLSYKISLYRLDTSPSSDIRFVNCSSHSECLIPLLMVAFETQMVQLIYFSFSYVFITGCSSSNCLLLPKNMGDNLWWKRKIALFKAVWNHHLSLFRCARAFIVEGV